MATPNQLRNEIYADLVGLAGLGFSGWMDSHYRTDLQQLADGALRCQVRLDVSQATPADSNLTLVEVTVQLAFHKRMTALETEHGYTAVTMVGAQEHYMDMATWLGFASVYAVAPDSLELVQPSERDGRIISWTLQVVVQLQP